METYLTQAQQDSIVKLFRRDLTVNEISEATGIAPREVLLFLTARGYWSKFCSDCSLKRCYDCRGLAELGQPISAQDTIDLIAATKKAKNDTGRAKT